MRTYSEREVSSIIERAVERQQAAERGGDTGLTLDEIERLGRESGIDPAHLRAAAAEIDESGRTLARQTGQSRTQVYAERWIDAPFATAGWEDAVAHLRTEFGAPIGAAFGSTAGETVQQIGQSFEWSHTSSLGVRTRATVSPRGDRTRLHLSQIVGLSSSSVEGVAYGGIIALVLGVVSLAVGAGLSGSLGVGVITGALVLVLSWIAAAPLVAAADRRWRAKRLRRLDLLADDLVPILRTPTAEPAWADAAEPVAMDEPPFLDLDALDDAPPESESRPSPNQRVR